MSEKQHWLPILKLGKLNKKEKKEILFVQLFNDFPIFTKTFSYPANLFDGKCQYHNKQEQIYCVFSLAWGFDCHEECEQAKKDDVPALK